MNNEANKSLPFKLISQVVTCIMLTFFFYVARVVGGKKQRHLLSSSSSSCLAKNIITSKLIALGSRASLCSYLSSFTDSFHEPLALSKRKKNDCKMCGKSHVSASDGRG